MAKCSVCVLAKDLLSSTVDPVMRDLIQADFKEHLKRQGEARETYYERRDEGISKKEVTSLIADGMDQAKTQVPRFLETPKDLDAKNVLHTHITGVLYHGRATKAYIDIGQFPHDANLTLNCILRALYEEGEIFPDGKRKLTEKIYIQLDNCGRENKNKYLLAFFALLVKWQKTKEVHVNFLMVGHTHEDIDQRFSCVSKRIRQKPAKTIPELVMEVRKSLKDMSVMPINTIYDIKSWLEPYLSFIGGHSTPHAFRIFEDKPGHVALKFKTWPKDELWLPENGSIELFKMNTDGVQLLPDEIPKLLDPNWEKLNLKEVESNIRKLWRMFSLENREWWEGFFQTGTILPIKDEIFWSVDYFVPCSKELSKSVDEPIPAISPLSLVMEKERKTAEISSVYNERKRRTNTSNTRNSDEGPTQPKKANENLSEQIGKGFMIVFKNNNRVSFGEVVHYSESQITVKLYRLLHNDILKPVVSRKGIEQFDTVAKESLIQSMTFILSASNKLPQKQKLFLQSNDSC